MDAIPPTTRSASSAGQDTAARPPLHAVVTPAPAAAATSSSSGSTTTTTQGVEALKDIACGSLAGSMGKVVEYPFDTVKVRLQSQPENQPLRYSGALDCFRQGLAHDGGVRGLYRGLSAPLVGAAAETACLFWSYRVAQDVLRATVLGRGEETGVQQEGKDVVEEDEKLPLRLLVLAGAISGGVTSLVLTPIELVKCRMQVEATAPRQQLRQAASPLTVIATVYRREGLRGFWRGQLGTLLRETGGSAAWFGSYETLSKYFKSKLRDAQTEQLPLWQQLTSGAVAGMGYNFVLYPADTIKSKMQTGELTHVRPTFMGTGKALWKAHGLKGLYRGCGITVARSAPSSALIFTIYESLRKTFN